MTIEVIIVKSKDTCLATNFLSNESNRSGFQLRSKFLLSKKTAYETFLPLRVVVGS